MSTLSVRLPDSVHRNARRYSEREGTSLNQLVATAVAEKLAALGAEEYIRQRAERADDDAFEAALAAVPDVPPREGD